MSLRIFLYSLLTTSLLVLGACGGGGGGGGDDSGDNGNNGGDNGGDNSGQNSKQIRNAKFGTGVWVSDTSGNLEDAYIVANDGETVRIVNCDIEGRRYDKSLTWKSDTQIESDDGSVTVSILADNSISFTPTSVGLPVVLRSQASTDSVKVDSPAALTTDGLNPTCGTASAKIEGGEQEISWISLVANEVYSMKVSFSSGYQQGGAYTSDDSETSINATVDKVDAQYLSRLELGEVSESSVSANPSVSITSCTTAEVSADFSGFDLGNEALAGSLTIGAEASKELPCSEGQDDSVVEEETELEDLKVYYPSLNSELAPVCEAPETTLNGELTGWWYIGNVEAAAVEAFLAGLSYDGETLDSYLADSLGAFLDSYFLIADEPLDDQDQGRVGMGACQASSPDAYPLEFRYFEMDRSGNRIGDSAGDLNAETGIDFFQYIVVIDEDQIAFDLNLLAQDLDIPQLVTFPKINIYRRPTRDKYGRYCLSHGEETTPLGTIGCIGFDNKDEKNLLSLTAEINGRLAVVYAEFNGKIGEDEYRLGDGRLEKVSFRYTDWGTRGLTEVENAYIQVDKIGKEFLTSIKSTNLHFVLRLPPLDEQGNVIVDTEQQGELVKGMYRSWRWR